MNNIHQGVDELYGEMYPSFEQFFSTGLKLGLFTPELKRFPGLLQLLGILMLNKQFRLFEKTVLDNDLDLLEFMIMLFLRNIE